MIPTLGRTIEAYCFLRRAEGLTDDGPTAGEIDDALALARRLAIREEDDPAAVFFALAKQPAPLGQAWPRFPALIGRNLAGGRGFVLGATIEELEELARAVCVQGLSFEVVRERFRARLHRL